jgi:hypothetical protein
MEISKLGCTFYHITAKNLKYANLKPAYSNSVMIFSIEYPSASAR